MKNIITIRLLGFNDSDRSKFESLLTIAENMLNMPWRVSESVDADYYLLKGNLKSQLDQDKLLKNLPREQCIFYSEQKTEHGFHEILVDKNNTPYLRSIIELLNKLSLTDIDHDKKSATFQTDADQQPVETAIHYATFSDEHTEEDRFDPEQGLLGLLIAEHNELQAFELNDADHTGKLYVDSTNKRYYCQDELADMARYFSETVAITQRSISDQRLQQVVIEENLKPLPLSNLQWYGAFASSKGRMIKEHQPMDIVHLKRWPDISLPGARKLIKLAAFMQSNAADLPAIQQRTGIPIDQIYNFFNACKVIGLIEYSQQREIHEKNLDDAQRRLFAKIGNRLKNNNNKQ